MLLLGYSVLAILLGFAGNWAKGAIIANRWLANRRIPVLALPAITFAAAIIAGAARLSLPGLHQRRISFLDNLFTSTSAVWVTGLTIYDISAALNPIGQTVLALLIQIGGLGTMTILGMLALWHGGAGFPVMANLTRVTISRIFPWVENRTARSILRWKSLGTNGRC